MNSLNNHALSTNSVQVWECHREQTWCQLLQSLHDTWEHRWWDGQRPIWQDKDQRKLLENEDDAKTWGLVVRQRGFQVGIGIRHVLEIRGGITETQWLWCGGEDDERQPGEEGKEAGQEVLLSILGINGGRDGVNTAFFTSPHSFDTSPMWPDIVIFSQCKCTHTFTQSHCEFLGQELWVVCFFEPFLATANRLGN